GLEALPAPARGGRGASREGASERGEEGERAPAAGRSVRREGDEGGRGAPDGRARREAARGTRGGPHRGSGREDPVPRAEARRQDAADRGAPLEVVRLARDLDGVVAV